MAELTIRVLPFNPDQLLEITSNETFEVKIERNGTLPVTKKPEEVAGLHIIAIGVTSSDSVSVKQ